uniref:Protein kinase domain-containing protein n=1 Tax=Acrobeloides nanus TaxID=290746 RepID=A0A914BVA8_9BILA
MTSKRNPNASRHLMDFDSIKDYEQFLKTWVQPGIFNYTALRVIERFSDEDGIVIEEMMLVEDKNRHTQFMLRIVELKDEQTLNLTLREAQVLNQNKDLTGLYASTLRLDQSLNKVRERRRKEHLGLFTPNAVIYVLRYVIDALEFMHSKQFVHTQLCATNIFMDGGGQVKLGGFLHSRRIGSNNWSFTGDPNCFPPEAFTQNNANLSIQPSFDYWSLGLLTLELITGKRESRTEEKCRKLSEKYRNGEKDPPTLADFCPNTLINNKQSYDPDVDSFLAQLLTVDQQRRALFSRREKFQAMHPFLKREIREIDARNEWSIPISIGSPLDGERSLFAEMFNSQSSRSDFASDFLTRILRAVRLTEKDFYPVFEDIPDTKLFNNYIGIEASIALANDDSEWSRDVLNVSRASSNQYLNEFEQVAPINKTRSRPSRAPLTGEDYDVQSHHPGLEKDYQRHETCFFVKKNWTTDERQVFIALQFARWYHRGVINFPDLVRVCDEIEDIIQGYIVTKSRAGRDPPESIYFASALRRLFLNPAEHHDRETRHLCHMYIDVALLPEMNAQKKKKMQKLSEGDSIDVPLGLTTLQAAACYKEVDARKFDAIEAQLLGQANVFRWELDETQRKFDAAGPETRLYKLLYERRRNPNRQAISNDWASNTQARSVKLWGDYDRDFLYKACSWTISHKLDESRARKLYGNPFEESQIGKDVDENENSLLALQLSRTRVKQEEDVILPMKRVEDAEARRAALANAEAMLARLKKGTQEGHAGGWRLGEQLKRFEADTSFNNNGFL